MFENLSERLGSVFDRLSKQGALSDEDVQRHYHTMMGNRNL